MAAEPVDRGAASPPAPVAQQQLPAMPMPAPPLPEQAHSREEPPAQLAAPDSGLPPSPGDKRAPACRVPGCTEPLTQLYNMRHRVCVSHYRADHFYMEPDGPLCRFCQQCAKPHTLDHFDPGRRSCRESLLRHNSRRKPLGAKGHASGRPRRRSPAWERNAPAEGSGGTNGTAEWQPPAEPTGPAPSSLSGVDPEVVALLRLPLPQLLNAQLPAAPQQRQQSEGGPAKRARLEAGVTAAAAAAAPAASGGQASPSSSVPSTAARLVQRSNSGGLLLRPNTVAPQSQPRVQQAALPAAQPAATQEQPSQVEAILASLLAGAAAPTTQPAAAPQALQAAPAPGVAQAAQAAAMPQVQQAQWQQQEQPAARALPGPPADAANAELLQTLTALQQRVGDLERQLAAERAQRAQRAAKLISQIGAGRGVHLLRAQVSVPGATTGADIPEDANLLAALAEALRRPEASASLPAWQSAAVPPPQPQPQPQRVPVQMPAQSWVGGQAQQAAQQQQQQQPIQALDRHSQRPQQVQRPQQLPGDGLAQLLSEYGRALVAQAQQPPARPQPTAGQAPSAVLHALLEQQAQRSQQAWQPGQGSAPVNSGGAAGAAQPPVAAVPAGRAQPQPDEVPDYAQSLLRLLLTMSDSDARSR